MGEGVLQKPHGPFGYDGVFKEPSDGLAHDLHRYESLAGKRES